MTVNIKCYIFICIECLYYKIMKTTLPLFLFCFLFFCESMSAQISLDTVFVSRRKSIENFTNIRYYYYPNLEAYYDTRRALYLYKMNGSWITSEHIPANYRGYCLRNSESVVIKGYLGDEPYTQLSQHRAIYPADFSSRRKPVTTVEK